MKKILLSIAIVVLNCAPLTWAKGPLCSKKTVHAPKTAHPHKIKALVLSCVDYRLASDDLPRLIQKLGLVEDADLITMPGASLAAVHHTHDKAFDDLRPAFYDMLDFLRKVHGFDWVYVVDHRDCGMYKYVYKESFAGERKAETAQHTENMKRLKSELDKKGLKSRFFLLDLDGSFEEISVG